MLHPVEKTFVGLHPSPDELQEIGRPHLPELFRAKVARATELRGFRFLHVLGACPPGWRYPTDQSVEIARLAVESRYFPLVAYDEKRWKVTFRPKHPVPVGEFLETQGRFSHLTPEQIDLIQAHVDERWELLEQLESLGAETETGVLA